MQAVIARAEVTEPHINAFTDTYFDLALEQAAAAADAYAAGTARALEGLPVAIKDESMIAGQRTTQGSLLFEDYVAETTDPVPERVMAAGGIVHARSAAPEFSMAVVTWSHLHGVTRNPWNLEITCGGSSGGAGASLAAGSSALAGGSDIGGSIRIPAAMNGLVGFKPPYGRVPEYWPWNREPFAASGPLARTVSDVILMQNVLSGPLVGDIWSLPPLELPETHPSLDGMRLAVSFDLGYFAPDAEIIAALERAVEELTVLGARVEVVELGWTERASEVVVGHLAFQAGTILRNEVPEDRWDELTPYIQDYLGQPVPSITEWIDGWAYLDHMYRDLQEKVFLVGHEALLCPTMATCNIPADWGHPETGPLGVFEDSLEMVMTYPFNGLGRVPVVSVPIGFSPSTRVPIGMQIVGPVNRDEVPFRVAAGWEAAGGPLFERQRPDVGT
jgi:Asp-tRNA(Asn)/Glu-tRNA(Gln) amidotransferase A subunit family amidase